jgi:hypothetical protein
VGDRADGGGDVADPVAGLGRRDAGLQRPGGGVDEVEVLLRGVPTTTLSAESETQPSTEAAKSRLSRSPSCSDVVVRQPVQHRVVDRGAQHLAERHRPERRVVVDVAGLRAALLDHLVRERVELEQVDADVGGLGQRVSTSATKRPAGFICSISAGVLRSSINHRRPGVGEGQRPGDLP